MRLLTIIIAVLFALWGGYWLVGSRLIDGAARDWFADQPGARYQALSVAGFPNRFDLTVDGLHLEAPDGSIAWDAPFAQVFALTYKPWHVIAALPHDQTVTLPDQVVTIGSTYLQGSLVVVPDSMAALDRITLVGRDLALTSTAGWRMGAAEVDAATRRDPAEPAMQQIGLRVTGLAPDPALTALLSGTDLPPVIGLIHLDARVTLTAPLDRFAGETRPQISAITLKDATLAWGKLTLTGTGDLVAGPDGLAEGRIDWTLRNWQAVPPALVATGLIKPEIEATAARMLEVLAEQSPDPDTLSLPLVFKDGRASLGPFPLGPAPRIGSPAGG